MKKLFFILISTIFFSNTAKAETCADMSYLPQMEFYSSYGKLQYNTTKNITQLTEEAQKYGLAKQGLFASGLSTVDISTDITTSTIGKHQSDGSICVYPTKIKLFIGFLNPLIYISNSIKTNSCEYKVVLRHEQTHQFINKEMLDYFLPLFREAFTKIVYSTPAIKINNTNQVDAASQKLTAEYNKKLQPLINFLKQEMINEQNNLDNKENYNREKNLCN